MPKKCLTCKFMLVPRAHRPCLDCVTLGGVYDNFVTRHGPPIPPDDVLFRLSSPACDDCWHCDTPKTSDPCKPCIAVYNNTGSKVSFISKRPPSGGSSGTRKSPADVDSQRADVATAVMVGLLSGGGYRLRNENSRETIAQEAVALADALIEELNKCTPSKT